MESQDREETRAAGAGIAPARRNYGDFREMRVTLSEGEYRSGVLFARIRYEENVEDNYDPKFNAPDYGTPKSKKIMVDGVLAEIAAAKALNVYCNVLEQRRGAPDIGGNVPIEIRSSAYRRGDMIVHGVSKDGNLPVIRVCQLSPREFVLEGWNFANVVRAHTKYEDKFNNERPAYFAPPRLLRKMSEFVEWLDEERHLKIMELNNV